MFSARRDAPTTIDLHGAKSIDLTASKREVVEEQLRQSGVVLAKWRAIATACATAILLVATLMTIPLGDWYFRARFLSTAVVMAVVCIRSYRRWRTLKSQTPPHQPRSTAGRRAPELPTSKFEL